MLLILVENQTGVRKGLPHEIYKMTIDDRLHYFRHNGEKGNGAIVLGV